MDPRRRDLAELGDNALWLPDLEPVDEMGVVQAFRACEKIASDVVQTFRSARHGRPEGLHYSDFFTGPSGLPAPRSVMLSIRSVGAGLAEGLPGLTRDAPRVSRHDSESSNGLITSCA